VSDFATLYEQEHAHVFGYVLTRVCDWHVAEDLTSATFEKALGLWQGHPRPDALLLSVARLCVLNYWRSARRRATYTFADVFSTLPIDRQKEVANDGGIEAVIEACDSAMAAALLKAALAQCDEQERRIIALRYAQRLPVPDVAACLGLTKQQYNKRHNTLMHRLARRLIGTTRRPYTPATRADCEICGAPHYTCNKCRSCYEAMHREERAAARREAVMRVL